MGLLMDDLDLFLKVTENILHNMVSGQYLMNRLSYSFEILHDMNMYDINAWYGIAGG